MLMKIITSRLFILSVLFLLQVVSSEHIRGYSSVSIKSFTPAQVLKIHTPQLLNALSDPHISKLTNDLWAVDLLSDIAKDEIITNLSLSRYRKASFMMNEVQRQVQDKETSGSDFEKFEKLCDVLKIQDDSALLRIAEKMTSKISSDL